MIVVLGPDEETAFDSAPRTAGLLCRRLRAATGSARWSIDVEAEDDGTPDCLSLGEAEEASDTGDDDVEQADYRLLGSSTRLLLHWCTR